MSATTTKLTNTTSVRKKTVRNKTHIVPILFLTRPHPLCLRTRTFATMGILVMTYSGEAKGRHLKWVWHKPKLPRSAVQLKAPGPRISAMIGPGPIPAGHLADAKRPEF
ncbi:MAG: hypothetical protein HKN05_13280 [Rhizobiales bacterium]|nr:hypothetical protein [Hyphomicrobiales bacterium]